MALNKKKGPVPPPAAPPSAPRLRGAAGCALPADGRDAGALLSSPGLLGQPLILSLAAGVPGLDPGAAAPEAADGAWTRQGTPRAHDPQKVTESGAARRRLVGPGPFSLT